MLEVRRFLGPKSKGQVHHLIQGLKGVERLIVEDARIKIGPTMQKALASVISGRKRFLQIELVVKNYEDIFEGLEDTFFIDSLKISTQEVSKYSSNKLFFEIAQGRIQVKHLALTGSGFSEHSFKKLMSLGTR